MEISYKMLQKLSSSYERASRLVQKAGIHLRTIVRLKSKHTAEPIDMSHTSIFKLLHVYIYTSTSKQKIPVRVRGKIRIPFYSTDVVFTYGYFTTSSYKITIKSCSGIRSPGAPYNCPHVMFNNNLQENLE